MPRSLGPGRQLKAEQPLPMGSKPDIAVRTCTEASSSEYGFPLSQQGCRAALRSGRAVVQVDRKKPCHTQSTAEEDSCSFQTWYNRHRTNVVGATFS